MTAHGDEAATLDGKNTTVHGSTDVTINGGGATLTASSGGLDAHGDDINLNT